MKLPRKTLAVLLVATTLSGCHPFGQRVTINTGEVGKQITSSGLEADIRQPGSFRMDGCVIRACPRLVRLQTAVSAQTVTIDKVFLPISNVSLDNVQFGIQFRIKQTREAIDQAFQDIRSQGDAGDRFISSEEIFATYIARKAPEAVIVALRGFTVEQALAEPDSIAQFARNQINLALADTPVEITEFGFPNGVGTPPTVVLAAKDRLYAIDEEKAREIRSLEAALEVESQRQTVARLRATNDIEIAQQLGISVEQYQCLRTLDAFADAANQGTTIAVAYDCGLSVPPQTAFIPLNQ